MNFDELKAQWDNQSNDDFQVDPNLNRYNSVGDILMKLRKNIQMEFISWLVAILFLLVLPHFELYMITGYVRVAYYIVLFQMCLASLFYYKKFYYFYKSTKQFNLLSSRENLLKLYYDLKFSIETYKMSSYLLTPQAILICSIILSHGYSEVWWEKIFHLSETWNNDRSFVLYFAIGLLVGLVLLFIFIELISHYYYGKYLKLIKKNIDDLEEETLV